MYQGGCSFHPIIFYGVVKRRSSKRSFYYSKYEVPTWSGLDYLGTVNGHAWYWQLEPTVSQLQAPCPAKTPQFAVLQQVGSEPSMAPAWNETWGP